MIMYDSDHTLAAALYMLQEPSKIVLPGCPATVS